MKINKYLTISLAAALLATGCYDDEGSYFTGSWTDIASVEGLSIPGTEDVYTLDLIEDETLSINPTIRFNKNVDESLFTYDWIMGTDTISSGLKLDWKITRTEKMVFNSQGETSFWLAIHNQKTGEAWRYYLLNSYGSIQRVKISHTITPKIGVFAYEKADGSVEWGSVKGSNATTPEDFSTLYTDLYTRYNSSRRIEGPIAGMGYNGSQLMIYTNSEPDYGAIVQTSESGSYAMGLFMGTIGSEVFQGAPDATIHTHTFYKGNMQELLIGNSLYIAPTNTAYQVIFPGSEPTDSEIAQIVGAKPYIGMMHFSVQRKSNGELSYYRYDTNRGYLNQELSDENGNVLKADHILGVCRQPSFLNKELKMFIAVRIASSYWLYTYTYEQKSSGKDVITYIGKADITAWAGGLNDNCQLFTNCVEVPLNYLYIVKGSDLWRTSYESQAAPQKVKSFSAPIVVAEVIARNPATISSDSDELYTAIFTYDETADVSTMYVLDAKSNDVASISTIDTPISGKVTYFRANQ